jgi:uncharacterized radical SAM superfamily Fe-S cluster-containing enzyme
MNVTLRDPKRYFDGVERTRDTPARPVCLYLEVTNRCNPLCETCPRTFEALEPPVDMSWDLFTRIVDQVPGVKRAVLHGVGEPMLMAELPRMVRYLKARGYENYTLGDAKTQTLEAIWNGPARNEFRAASLSDAPPKPCQNCGMRWSL